MEKQTGGNAANGLAYVSPSVLAKIAANQAQIVVNALKEKAAVNTERAQRVMDALSNNDADEDDGARVRRINKSIAEFLDADSIYFFVMLIHQRNNGKSARSALAKKGADAVHKENRAMKAEVFTWLDANMVKFKSMDAAAKAITKEQPIEFRTARDWVGKWKKVRSASTP